MDIRLTPQIVIPFTEHAYVVGVTGSGKSTLIRKLFTEQVNYAIVIDTKEDMQWPGFKVTKNPLSPLNRPGKWIFRPPQSWTGAQWDIWLRAIKKAGGYYVYIDESHDLTLARQNVIYAFTRFISTARGANISVWAGSQRPRWLPKAFVTETRHKFLFFDQDEADRKYMASVMVRSHKDAMYDKIVTWDVPEHGFIYSNTSKGLTYQFAPIKIGK